MPGFPVSVPMEFYLEVAALNGEAWADSYLFGATLHGGKLIPRTQTAWTRLRDDFSAQKLFRDRGISLIKPPPFEPIRAQRQHAA